MRKKGILALVVIIAIFVALSYIFTDRWLESTMESVGSSMVGAKVEFDGVDFSFLKLKMRWDRLQVTDPKDTWRNMFETGHCDFDVAFEPLLSKKIIIEDFKMEGLELNTRRETDGTLPQKAETPRETPKIFRTVQNQLQEETAKMPVFNLSQYTRKVNVDSLWRMVNLKSPQKIDSLKTYYAQKYDNWEKRLQNLPDEKELQNLQSQVQSIQVDQIKTVDEFQSALNKANRLYKQADSLNKNFRQLKTDFQDDFKQVNTVDDIMKQWIQQDYQRVLNLANIPEISVQNVARILFGRQIIDKIQRVNGYVGTARYYSEKFKSTQPKKENPPRLKGQTIYFTSKRNWPKFWVKQIALSGEVWNDMKISGTVKNIVSQQKVIGQPTTIDINGTRRDQAS
ncbi:MAG: TIGR03545 family protein, partial [Calditrichia bacterium]